ncbi:MAG: AAA family ATPase [Deltaproteobacteria bacterium RIFCSPLOWO2_02_FULL_44_10]|nr:MAG: AAA family ATPase [Deltaproteobacteria bacterium RIFCSPHIGHO2_02_FULL_44_16]OGQ47137.1 MAG: AAA family ATPase [Deltaproteobacteria bacterium RIFCSPLOWO2_02_FULL_44_10]
MIVYSSTKQGFLNDVMSNDIHNEILYAFQEKLGHSTSINEIMSWQNSMPYMARILDDQDIPADAGVAIEYKIPQTSRRVDFILTGLNEQNKEAVVLIELKQWSTASMTGKDAVVETYVGHALREVNHPSYQAWSYAMLIEDYNQTVQEEEIEINPCAYLHNYTPDEVISDSSYAEYIDKAPLFLKPDALALRAFIKKFVKHGDNKNILYRIDNGRIRPSKNLADKLSSLLQGNQEFIMIDDQKIVFETAKKLATESTEKDKHVLIIEGGPGTGKTVVAINLLVQLTKKQLNTQYITRNSAPRLVYESKLAGTLKRSQISNLFSGSGSFHHVQNNVFDALIVDEAHRLNAKSGMFKHMGENQVKEIIEASKFSIFFVDENQKVTLHDIGTKDEIRRWAIGLGATVHEMELTSQFRCNGSDGYLSWLDNALQIRETANETLEGIDYDFRVMSSANELRDLIYEKNKINNKARMVAGYCWKWLSKKNPLMDDIIFPEQNFSAKWNLDTDGMLWIVKPDSVKEVGCIHTCQGLELDYVGVIIGLDFVIRNGEVVTDVTQRASSDKSVHGYKKLLMEDPENTMKTLDLIVKNTYRTLMTRGQKGCYVYFVDKETEEWFRARMIKFN